MSATDSPSATSAPIGTPVDTAPVPRVWPAMALIVTYWVFVGVSRILDLEIYRVFMSNMGAAALVTLLFLAWWSTNRRIKATERLIGVAAMIVGGGLAAALSDPSVGPIGVVLFGAPVSVSVWLVWILFTRRRPAFVRRTGMVFLILLVWASQVVVRVDGVWGDNNATVSWRWSRSAEDRYLAQRTSARPQSQPADPGESSSEELVLQPGDWPEFRGPLRQGELHGATIATDWEASAPKPLWRQKIGPAWSSVVIVGDRLFTQEQRGEAEVVVCLDSSNGCEIWSHEDTTRYSDGQAGAGPRATPTFSEGRIYSLGANGILNNLEAATGKLHWTRNIMADSAAPLPMWGFSSSPLVTEGIVAVFAGGETDKGLLAYRIADGEMAWTTATGPVSYSSPQLVSIDGQSQMLVLTDLGLVSVEPETGRVLWQHEAPKSGLWRVVQPRQVDDNGILIGSEDLGLVRLDVSRRDQSWIPTQQWSTRAIRPAYNDFVLSDGFVYGLDGGVLCCVEMQGGKRRWKAGRYGHGQILLIADQRVLLVVSEKGEAVLVAANPESHQELGRIQAIEGKTWNHPVIARDRLYVRNDEEIACYDLKPADAQ